MAHDPAEGDLRVSTGLVIPAAELRWRFSRSSGPGGQGVNTADSRVELVWNPAASSALSPLLRERLMRRLESRLVGGLLVVVASEHRAQLRNRHAARTRMAALVADAVAPPAAVRRRTRPTRASQQRRVEAKQRRSQLKRLRRHPGSP